MVANDGGPIALMPSVVGHDDTGAVVVGEDAESLDFPIRSIKRVITANKQFVRADLVARSKDERADPLMVAIVAEAVRRAAGAGAKVQTRGAVRLGCPAMWTGEQRRRLVKIANKAGLPVKLDALVDEPVAAGIAWLAGDTTPRPDQFRVVVFDMGGGTLDIAVLDVRGHQDVAVLAAYGISEAGDTLDDAIAADLESMLDVRVDALDSPDSAHAELRAQARLIKHELSTEDEAPANFSALHFNSAEIWYTRDQLEAAFLRQMDDAVMAVGLALRLAKLTEQSPGKLQSVANAPIEKLVQDVDVVVLAGGMAHVPAVRTRLEAMFGPRTEVVTAYPAASDRALKQHPELAIAVGLAQTDHYGRINMYRPALDILLELENRRVATVLYEAFTPMMSQGALRAGSREIAYTVRGRDLKLPATGTGTIRVVSHNGSPVASTLDGRSLDGFPVAIDGQKFEFTLYPYGRIRMVDAAGTHEGHLDDWHVI
jgi:molecular chaperone DnaK (HSP70)